MDILIRFLVQALDTVDGRKGTASFYTEASIHYEIERQEKKRNKKVLKRRSQFEMESDEEYDDSLQLQLLNEEEKL